MLNAEREKVLRVRSTGAIPHEVIEDVLAALDVEESMLDIHSTRLETIENAEPVRGSTGTIAACDHLASAPRDVESRVEERVRGLRAGRLHRLGPPPQVPRVRPHGVLRLVSSTARVGTLRGGSSPGDALGRARRGLALVLRRQPHRLTSTDQLWFAY